MLSEFFIYLSPLQFSLLVDWLAIQLIFFRGGGGVGGVVDWLFS